MTGNRIVLSGDLPSPAEPAVGLPLPHPLLDGPGRSATEEKPALIDRGTGRPAACHFVTPDRSRLARHEPAVTPWPASWHIGRDGTDSARHRPSEGAWTNGAMPSCSSRRARSPRRSSRSTGGTRRICCDTSPAAPSTPRRPRSSPRRRSQRHTPRDGTTETRERTAWRGSTGSRRHQLSRFFRHGTIDAAARRKLGMPCATSRRRTTSGSRSWSTSRRSGTRCWMRSAPSREEQRDALRLRVIDGLPYAEVAERLGCDRGGRAAAREPRASARSRWPCNSGDSRSRRRWSDATTTSGSCRSWRRTSSVTRVADRVARTARSAAARSDAASGRDRRAAAVLAVVVRRSASFVQNRRRAIVGSRRRSWESAAAQVPASSAGERPEPQAPSARKRPRTVAQAAVPTSSDHDATATGRPRVADDRRSAARRRPTSRRSSVTARSR